MSQTILSVAEFVRALKSLVVGHRAFQNVALVGEISNFNAHHSGHFYFSLKDKDARISCVMFRSKSSAVLFKPKNGDKVVIMGYVDVFESAGTIQIYVERMNLDGLGDLHIQYEKLKKLYLDKGYFDASHKKVLPQYPRRIGVITGADSAAYADISRSLKERWPMAQQVDLLAYVQGEKAVESLVSRIHEAQTLNLDAIILARGGGSIEDLWAFNEERVIEAVFNSSTVIVSGVGHESDTTLVDFVSDYRAATPTAAAVSLTPDVKDVLLSLRNYKNSYYIALRNKIRTLDSIYQKSVSDSHLSDPLRYLELISQQLDYQQARISAQLKRFDQSRTYLNAYKNQLSFTMERKLSALNLKTTDYQSLFMQSVSKRMQYHHYTYSRNQERLDSIERYLKRDIVDKRALLLRYNEGLVRTTGRAVTLNKLAFNDIIKTLDLLSPLKIMMRGYALVYHEDQLVKSVKSVEVGDELHLRMKDGTVVTTVEKRVNDDEL